ncbi:MAG: NAD(P)H-binding protein, partial [Pseudomonadota bacterium]
MESAEYPSKRPHGIAGGVLVTGSAGFIGREVASKLAATNAQVVSMYHYRLPEAAEGLYPFSSDLSSPDLLATPLRGISTVVHLAWSTKGAAADNARAGGALHANPSHQHAGANIPMLRNLIAGMERAGTKRIVFLSALGARRNCENLFLLEKYICELMIINSDIPEKVIIRSASVISGPISNDRMVQSLLSSIRWPGVYPL